MDSETIAIALSGYDIPTGIIKYFIEEIKKKDSIVFTTSEEKKA